MPHPALPLPRLSCPDPLRPLCYSCPSFRVHRKQHKKLGQQAWLVAAITVTELLIVVKYDPHTLTLSLPFYISQCWMLGSVLVLTWTVWRFFLR